MTLDNGHATAQSSEERSETAVELGSLVDGFGFLGHSTMSRPVVVLHLLHSPCRLISMGFLRLPIRRTFIDSLPSQIFPRKSGPRHPRLPCFYPHSDGPLLGPVHVGVRFHSQVHHRSGRPGIVWGCYLWGDLIDQHEIRSHPNKAADVVLPNLRKSLGSVLAQLLSARILLANLVLEIAFSLLRCFSITLSPLCSRRHRQGRARAQGLIHLARYPQSMQQDGEFAGYRHRRSLLRILPAPFAQPQPVPS